MVHFNCEAETLVAIYDALAPWVLMQEPCSESSPSRSVIPAVYGIRLNAGADGHGWA